MSSRIAAAITLNTEGFTAGVRKVQAEATGLTALLQRQGVGLFGGKSAADSAGAIGEILRAEEKLKAARKNSEMARASDTGKIAILEREIAEATARAAAIQGTSVEKLQLQLGIEERILEVEKLRAGVAATIAREQSASAAAETARLARIAQLEAVGRQRRTAREAAALSTSSAVPLLGAAGGAGAAAAAATPARGGGLLATAGGVLGRAFGAGAILKGLLAGAGIGTALQVIDGLWGKISARMERAADLARTLAGYYERMRAAGQQADAANRTPAQELQRLRNQERTLARQLQFASQSARDGDGDPAEVGRLGAELAENRASQAQLRPQILAAAEDRVRRANEVLAIQRQAADEREARARSQMPLEAQLEDSQRRQARFEAEAAKAKAGSLAQARASLRAEQEITEQTRLRGEIAAETQAAWQRAIDAQEKAMAEHAAARERVAQAEKRVGQARDALATARRDALASSPEELTRTSSGARDTTAQGLLAAQILRDEATARRLFRSGGSMTMWDSASQRNFQADAEFFQTRALDARSGWGALTSEEQNPFAAAEEALRDAATELSEAAAELKTIEVTVET